MLKSKTSKLLLALMTSTLIMACSENGVQNNLFEVFEQYAKSDGGTEAPTADDYTKAGIDLKDANIDDLNNYLKLLSEEDVDTKAEIQAIADNLGVLIVDTDGDGIPNGIDPDDDGDGVNDNEDAFPLDGDETIDTDGDGIGNNADPDDDNDGTSDEDEATNGTDPLVNEAPVANAGVDQTVTVGSTVTLDGSASSDADSPTITYDWELTVPAGSTAVLSDSAIMKPTFTADVEGNFSAKLIVSDGNSDSSPDTVSVGTTEKELENKLALISHQEDCALWTINGQKNASQVIKRGFTALSDNNNIRCDEGIVIQVADTSYFSAHDGEHGFELWKSNGTEEGTVMIKDIQSGDSGSDSNPTDFTKVGDMLYFIANDGIHGKKIWKSNGTPEGTVMVEGVNPNNTVSRIADLTDVNGVLFFRARGDNDDTGTELWKSDGTENGTKMVKDFSDSFNGGDPRRLTNVNGVLYFDVTSEEYGREVWKSDGTEGGTKIVKDIVDGNSGSSPLNLLSFKNTLYFTANKKLWKSNGTENGTTIHFDSGRRPGKPLTDGENIYFSSWNTVNQTGELWLSDGSNAEKITDVDFSGYERMVIGSNFFFTGESNPAGEELWFSDGTNTNMVKDINGGGEDSNIEFFGKVNGVLLFTTYLSDNEEGKRKQLWRSNGTRDGTVMLIDIR